MTFVYNDNFIKKLLEEVLNIKNNDNCFPHHHDVFCFVSMIGHLTEVTLFHRGANKGKK